MMKRLKRKNSKWKTKDESVDINVNKFLMPLRDINNKYDNK